MSENGSRDKKLSAKQRAAIAALLDGKSYGQTALVAGVSERTLFRWRDEVPEFNYELERRGRHAIRDATTQLTGGLETAISFLLDVVNDRDAPYSVRVRAALGLIDKQLSLVEQSEIVERLAALEQRINEIK